MIEIGDFVFRKRNSEKKDLSENQRGWNEFR